MLLRQGRHLALAARQHVASVLFVDHESTQTQQRNQELRIGWRRPTDTVQSPLGAGDKIIVDPLAHQPAGQGQIDSLEHRQVLLLLLVRHSALFFGMMTPSYGSQLEL